ncbi:uncharacterized protein LOC143579537 [Bidens hawaiensis]|uniref:uncharacterized protein LOC143579537 n=1 Tax=Bidens hawaiensis TaxID=980011 RepID=UPI0040497BA7
MEIAELNLLGDFEAGMKCLQNPSLISKLSLINKLPQIVYSIWTCGALVIAVFATFTSVFNNIKLLLHHIRVRFLLLSCQNSPHHIFNDDDDCEFDFSDDDTMSSVAGSDDDGTDSEDERVDNEVFRVEGSGCNNYFNNSEGQNGNFTLRRCNRFSWSDFSAGKSVVQLWDSFGLGLDFEDYESDPEGKIAIWDLGRDVKLSSGKRCQVADPAAENVVLTAEMNGNNGGVGFATYDFRVDARCPALYATWRPRKIWLDDDKEE